MSILVFQMGTLGLFHERGIASDRTERAYGAVDPTRKNLRGASEQSV
jgi:hypothetical protein